MKSKLHPYLLMTSGILLAASLISYLFRNISLTGIFLIAGFIALATGVRGYEKLKGFSYTIWIFTVVTASMFYPQYFTNIGNFQLKSLIVPLLQIIMFGM
ncbi:MAG: bile acid:sodium symporter family protein, partial [Bacteroidales bacterium]|nr:bile acid:sodium symporter family protein [Bacteroidales bacterium]